MRRADYQRIGPQPETPEPAPLTPWSETRVVGQPLERVDAYERLSGTAVFPSDLHLPEMLYAAILRCPHAHARVRRVDVSRALEMAGVRSVLTAEDSDAAMPWQADDEGPATRLFDPHCLYDGEEVAAVAAETPHQAWDAVRAIEVDYEVLPHVVDEGEALAPGAPRVHPSGNLATEPSVYERGDVMRGLAEADVVVERTYRTACLLHTPIEPHGCVVRWDGRRLVVWESTQGVYSVQRQLARAFELPLASVRVIGHYMGGGFGSKLSTGKYALIAALLARRTARPVKLFLTREETMLAAGNRPANTVRLKAGARRDGSLTALELEAVGTGGAHSPNGTGLVDWQVRDLYRCPNVRTVCRNVYVHAGAARPMRAPGHPQGAWALEQAMDELAEKLALDPVELRLRNLTGVSQARGGIPYTSTGFAECLTRGAEAFGWSRARARARGGERGEGAVRRGVGVAGCLWVGGAGGPPATVIVKLFADGSAHLNMGASDLGTGTKTVMAMVVAEELGVPIESIQIEHADTGTTEYATPSGGSKTVPTEAPAVRAAALECKRQVLAMAAAVLGSAPSDLRLESGAVVSAAGPRRRVALQEIEPLRRAQVVVGIGYRGPNPQGRATCPFGAQFCEVEVDTRTGEVRVLRFLGAHDSGRVMNRKTYDSQVHGGIVMGLGLGVSERRTLDRLQTGRALTRSWLDYKIPTALDVPADVVSLPVETVDVECNAAGAKGLGEPVTIPTAAAIANAVFDATGVRVTEAPISLTRLLPLLEEARPRGAGR